MWKLEFSIANGSQHAGPRPGSWCISLSLLENSPPTWIDSRLLVQEPDTTSPLPSPDKQSPTSHGRSASSPFVFGASRPRAKPTISIRVKSTQQLFANRPYQAQSKVVVSLEDSLMGSSLQYAYASSSFHFNAILMLSIAGEARTSLLTRNFARAWRQDFVNQKRNASYVNEALSTYTYLI